MSPLKVGLVGLGIMGRNHARVLSHLDGVELLGIVDPVKPTDLNPSYNFFELSELLAKKPDYCVISAPTGFHKDIAIQILEAGINCLIEKPVSLDLDSAYTIKAVADKNSLVVGVGHIERFNSAIRQLRIRLMNGDLGDIYQVCTRRQGPFPSRVSDVGVVRDLGTHDIDLIMWLTGSKFKSVSAHAVKRAKREFEDLVSVTGRLENEVIVNMLVNWLSPLKERNLLVTGEKGAFTVDTLSSNLTYFSNGNFEVTQNSLSHFVGVSQGDIISYAFEKPEPLLVEHQNFRDHLLGKKTEIVTIEEGIETVRVSDMILESSRTGTDVKF
jgi:UDP-N-acetylglucosamine 3-dehydrogenase